MTVHLNFSSDAERLLKEKAGQLGLTVEAYLEAIIERLVRAEEGSTDLAPSSQEDFEQILDQLCEGLPSLPTLPADFSRADIYGEHP